MAKPRKLRFQKLEARRGNFEHFNASSDVKVESRHGNMTSSSFKIRYSQGIPRKPRFRKLETHRGSFEIYTCIKFEKNLEKHEKSNVGPL